MRSEGDSRGARIRTADLPNERGVRIILPSLIGGADGEARWLDEIQGATRPVALDLFCGAGGLSQGFQDAGFFVAGLDTAGDTEVRDMPVADGPLVLVVGSEGRGLSRVVAAACDLLVRIPMASGTESLNAGVAASIALYEIATARSRLA